MRGGDAVMMRCVLVMPEGDRPEAAPSALLAGLTRRGMQIQVVSGAPRAMLEVARQPRGALVVVDPPGVVGAGELIEAVRSYYPQVVCWQFCGDEGAQGRLRAYGEGPTPRDEPQPNGRAQDPDSPLISRDELAMLLGRQEPAAGEARPGG